ncbi:MAG: hypothetical protein ACLQNE_10200 [Thermoguttaceae bacterium]
MLRRKFRMTRSADFRGIVIAWVALLTCMAALTYANQNMPIRSLAGQSCWVLSSEDVELAVTRQGGHMAPVTFCRKDRQPVQPYYISPWQQEKVAIDEPVMRPLRGNFFCLPFGANQESVEGVKFPAHGETAGQPWTLVNAGRSGATTTLTLALKTKVRPGKVTKTITLVDGQNAVYTRHVIEGFSGKAPLGHHATLAVPEKEGVLRVATSLFAFGMTAPVLFSDPAQGEYQSFAIHARFNDLHRVPLLWKDPSEADCTRFPARTGFADLLAIFKKPSQDGLPAWTAVVNREDGYLWFSLKDPAVLPSTVFWIENHGRHEAPWNGRNRCLGLEDVCAYFDRGIAESIRPNAISRAGVPTAIELSPHRPTVLNYVEGAAKIPARFETVQSVEFAPGRITFISSQGDKVAVPVDWEFLKDRP